ncbi:hypothetical protein MLD38_025610 [Melastoma candidum]|uniref:Uncharacterized protein n=1 Tax=Melastoma candidum TaxID=119954 RepID=A0ACB9NWD4_9MYRT|nr:hypothetical protein MLD38_025610 [Melastoma candidum]
MGSQLIREWTGIQRFPLATQSKLLDSLGILKNQSVSSLTILVVGKGGVGKSSTVNSILGERALPVGAFQSETQRPVMVSRSTAGFTLNVVDTPGLVEGGYVNGRMVETIKSRFLLNKTVDILLYVDRLDTYRVDSLDKQVVQAITESFGKDIWKRALVVLTHAQLLPPDGLEYDVFSSKRSEALLKVVRSGARIKKQDAWASGIPVALVENGGICNKNDNDEQVLPSGIAWISNVVRNIVDVALNGNKGILVDKKLVEGANPDRRWKEFIPFIFAFQYFLVVKPIERAIKKDMEMEVRPSWDATRRGF